MANESWIPPLLERLRAEGLERTLHVLPRGGGKFAMDGREYLNFSCNDYLNLARDPRVLGRAAETLDRFGAGAGASRLVTGTLDCHAELEAALAAFESYPAALVFGSGCLANAGLLSTLLGRGDVVFADKLVHATILDGIVLSRAKLHRFHHNDVEHLGRLMDRAAATGGSRGRFLVATESVFSMDGDLAPLGAICDAAQRHDAMVLVDEAHALGVFGPMGAGLVREQGLGGRVNACVATFSKALGSYGGFVACSRELRELLIHRARSFLYSTALPPASVGAALAALEILRTSPDLGAMLLSRARLFRRALEAAGLNTMRSESHIIPLLIGDNGAAVRFSARLKERGILATAIREPTVPRGTARIRLSATLAHSEEDLRRAARIIAEVAGAEGLL
ncbi:MAG: aminotransferase class I/II-fold pyridoxal phosphate-dependent enzyme [Thermoguttaceae bacterium]